MESISCKIASCGWHYYGQNTWKRPEKNETVFAEKERNKTALEKDPYSIAWKKKNKSKITFDTVGHCTQRNFKGGILLHLKRRESGWSST